MIFNHEIFFIIYISFFWRNIKFSQQNINQSEIRIGDKKLSVKLMYVWHQIIPENAMHKSYYVYTLASIIFILYVRGRALVEKKLQVLACPKNFKKKCNVG